MKHLFVKGHKHSEKTKEKIRNKLKGNINAVGRGNGFYVHNEGYIMEMCKGHPFADKKGFVLQHRLVMEKKLGRYLTKDEIVHHRNSIRNDNRIKNLKLFNNRGEHKKWHLILGHN